MYWVLNVEVEVDVIDFFLLNNLLEIKIGLDSISIKKTENQTELVAIATVLRIFWELKWKLTSHMTNKNSVFVSWRIRSKCLKRETFT